MLLAALVLACNSGDTGFNNRPNDDNLEEGAGKILIEPDAPFVFDDCEVGVSVTTPFRISNVGDGVLQVKGVAVIDPAGGQFFLDKVDPFELTEGMDREFLVGVELAAAEDASGQLRIQSSDSEAPTVLIDLVAHVATADSGGD